MPVPPPCTRLGRQCRELTVTVHIANLDEDTPAERDESATWLLGHTERIQFGKPYVRGRDLYADAVVQVECKHLRPGSRGVGTPGGNGRPEVQCGALGYRGALPQASRLTAPTFHLGPNRYRIVEGGKIRELVLAPPKAPKRALPVMQGANPCDGAPCRTADNTRGAACCRDLTLDVVAPIGDDRTEALLRSRKSPYLCKVKRSDDTTIECEVISACGYLADDGISCVLHDRLRPDGTLAKPGLCYEWPDFEDDEEYTGHPGCVLIDD